METTKVWISLGTIVSPITGTFFTKIITQYNHKYLLWYNGEYLIKPGDNIKFNNNGIVVSEKLRKINIIQIDKYSPTLWRVMHNMSSCLVIENLKIHFVHPPSAVYSKPALTVRNG